MIQFKFNPFRCECSLPFNTQIKSSSQNNNKTPPKSGELCFEGRAIRISGVSTKQLVTKGQFTEVERSKVENISVVGVLYLHDCEGEINQVSATDDIVVYNCHKINHIVTEGDLFIVHDEKSDPHCQYLNKESKNYTVYTHSKPKKMIVKDFSVGGILYLDEDIYEVEIYENCQIPKIIFKGAPDKRLVIVKKGAHFAGEVVGGKVVIEGEE